MKINSIVEPLEGVLLIQKVYPDGKIEEHLRDKNIIVLVAKRSMLAGLYSSITTDPISTLRVGTGGAVDPLGLFPKSITQNLSGLFTPLLNVYTSYTTDLNVPSVTFIADLDQGTGNDQLITEAGLFQASGNMFNIKTFPAVPKTSEFSLHFEWTIKLA